MNENVYRLTSEHGLNIAYPSIAAAMEHAIPTERVVVYGAEYELLANAHDALVAVLRCAKALRAREMELANEAKWMYVDDLNRGFLAGELDRALAAPELAGLLKEISDAK